MSYEYETNTSCSMISNFQSVVRFMKKIGFLKCSAHFN